MYIQAILCQHEIYYGIHILVNGKYTKDDWSLMYMFGWEPKAWHEPGAKEQWEKFCEWFWYTYPIGFWVDT